ncbi:MAG: hypothetical protein IPO92_15875 [Saprospiraceae bacterium]|nr:hypothetical protein [Saprospiraceae bacterium]
MKKLKSKTENCIINMNNNLWIKIGIINLVVVACIGVLMRYKIGFEFPYFDQKYLLHGHSHFAFSGWVTHILFVLLFFFLKENRLHPISVNRYTYLIYANLISAYGMLISFIIQGYGMVSITFSTLSILVGYLFAWYYIKDIKLVQKNHPSIKWFKAALVFNVLSSFGTFYLAYMMATKNMQQHSYLGSVYFYLHFQYSGWFFFAIMGLLMEKLYVMPGFKNDNTIFNCFLIACIPAYLLSVLWLKLPWYLFVLPIISVVLQLYGLYSFLILLRNQMDNIKSKWLKEIRFIFSLALMALIIKLFLQAASIFPEISKLAFGFRSIVIAYLHLVLLGITTLFLLGYLLLCGYIKQVKISFIALILFCVGVFTNELVLMVQGLTSFVYILIPYLNQILLGVSVFMLGSLILLLFSYKKI